MFPTKLMYLRNWIWNKNTPGLDAVQAGGNTLVDFHRFPQVIERDNRGELYINRGRNSKASYIFFLHKGGCAVLRLPFIQR